MFIDVLTVGGSPRGIDLTSIWNRGIGGAELMLFTWAQEMVRRGNIVRIYNDPPTVVVDNDKVQFYPVGTFNPPDKRDVLITYRGPSALGASSYKRLHIGWSTDQYTEGDYVPWYNEVDKMVLISEFHKKDHVARYPGAVPQIESKSRVIDIGTDVASYIQDVQKVENQVIFCSVPDRGLQILRDLWPAILTIKPNLKLFVTSDYTLWGWPNPNNEQYRLSFIGLSGVKFLGNIPRAELIKYQLQSEAQLYPCVYDENFCIANSECQIAGCYTITSNYGALPTTNFTGKVIPYGMDFGSKFVQEIKNFFDVPFEQRLAIEGEIAKTARERFDIKNICDQWEKQILNV